MSSRKAGLKTSRGKIAIVADPHIGPRGLSVGAVWEQGVVADRMLMTLYELFIWAEENHIRSIIVAGDFFDRRLITPLIIGKLQEHCKQLSSKGYRLYILSGNHDVDVHSGNALDYLSDLYIYKVVDPCIRGHIDDTSNISPATSILFAPFVCGMTAEDSVKAAVEKLEAWPGNPPNTLIGHFGVYSDGAAPWELADPLSVHVDFLAKLLRRTGIKLVACGHYHNAAHFELKDLDVYQVGALSPRNFGENGLMFGNVLEVRGTAEGPVQTIHHMGAISGIRYIANESQLYKPFTSEIKDPGALQRCWFVLKDVIDPFPIKSKVVQSPATVNDVMGGAVTVANYHQLDQRYDRVEIGPEGLSPQHAIAYHCKALIKQRGVEGPTAGLLVEAIGRTQGTNVSAFVEAPPRFGALSLVKR